MLVRQGLREKRFERPSVLAEKPGQTFTAGKMITIPRLSRSLSLGVVLLNWKAFGVWGCAFLPVYYGIDQGLDPLLRYSNHGDENLSKWANRFIVAILLGLTVTFFTQVTVETIHGLRVDDDARSTEEYRQKMITYQADLANYENWVRDREEANERAEESRQRTAQSNERANAQAARQTSLLIKLARESRQRVALPVVVVPSAVQSQIVEKKEERRPPIEPAAPVLVAREFQITWQLRLKLLQAFDPLVMVAALGYLLCASARVNRESWEVVPIPEEERKLLEYVVADEESIAQLPDWAKGNSPSNATSLPEEIEEKDDLPTPPIEAENEVEAAELDHEEASVSKTTGEASQDNDLPSQDEICRLDAVLMPEAAVSAVPEKRKKVSICNNRYSLIPRVSRGAQNGWKLYHAGPIDLGVRYIFSVTEKEGNELLGAADVDREEIVERLKVEKKKALPPPPSIQERLARRATG